MKFCCTDLITLFNSTFRETENTELVGFAEEPLYLPGSPHRIYFTRDYFASALHEIAHWCIAGPMRRLQEDYGYWYYPDGRSSEQQALFLQVEAKPQAIECLFSKAARYPFRVSLDNLSGDSESFREAFEKKVLEQVQMYERDGLPRRAQVFSAKLLEFYQLQRISTV